VTARLIHAAALAAALLVVLVGLWQYWPLASTLKRLVLAYFICFSLGSLGALFVRTGAVFGGDYKTDNRRCLRRRRARPGRRTAGHASC